MKKNLIYFLFSVLIITAIGVTSVWKKNNTSIDIPEDIDISTPYLSYDNESKIIEAETEPNQKTTEKSITYDGDNPILNHMSNFSEAFIKARSLESENFWFNDKLYHTKLKEKPLIIEKPNINDDKIIGTESILTQIP